MLYRFYDTTEQPGVEALPAEAVCINGTWLDEAIPQYRTLAVSGRELLPIDWDTYTAGTADGSHFNKRRIPERTITVKYQITAEDPYTFREVFEKLSSLLHVHDALIIFADEPDRYFIGTPLTDAETPEEGRLSVTGWFEILCADPFRYSLEEYEVEADENGVMTVEYDGTYPSRPVLTAVSASDLGVVAFVDLDENSITIGDPDEVDTETAETSETVLNDSFLSAMPADWAVNAIVALEPDVSTYKQIGTVKVTSEGLTADSYGSDSKWHGVTVKKEFGEDSNGHVGAANCTVTWNFRFWSSTVKKNGELMLYLIGEVDGAEKIIASYHVYKPHTSDNILWIYFYLNGSQKKRWDLTASQASSMTGKNGTGVASIAKFGKKFTFNFCGTSYEYENPDLETIEVSKVAMFFEQYGTLAPVDHNFVRSVKAVSHGVETWEDVQNKFAAGDVITADVGSGQITLNGIPSYGLGVISNNWEEFALTPGKNVITCTCSDWAAESPTYKIKYRKVWL